MLLEFSKQSSWLLSISQAALVLAAPSHRNGEESGLTHERALFPRSYTLDCKRSNADLSLLKAEFENAAKMADFASKNLGSDGAKPYLQGLVAQSLLDPNANIINQLQDEYGRGAKMPGQDDYKFTVTCDDKATRCKNGYYASMSDNNSKMNFCSAWWDVIGTPAQGKPQLVSTDTILAACKGDDPQFKNLQDFWPSRAQSLLHELTHTKYYKVTDRTFDYAYGVQNCLDLAAGSRKMPDDRALKKDGTPYCPDPNDNTKPGICDPTFSIDNADSLALIASGTWFSDAAQCKRQIPIALTANPPSAPEGDPGTPIDPPGEDTGDPDTTCTGNTKRDGENACTPVTTPAPSPVQPPVPATPPYAPGKCSFHMTYWRPYFWRDGTNPYNIEMRILDDKKNTIGWLPHTKDSNKMTWNVVSRLEDPMEVTPESQNDYVQFTLPGQSWRTDKATDQSKLPNCSVGHWNCSDEPCVSHHLPVPRNLITRESFAETLVW
ncbi:MAG: hypothetical protein LQ350_008145 [Teloschistes chrysophthalmus]|nr:MAG: hypothetical protein LQ350_008145 [Niorma chrysophthalma]